MTPRLLLSIPAERNLNKILKNFRPKIMIGSRPSMIIPKISFFYPTKGFQL